MIKDHRRFLITVLLIAWAFDLLFWDKSPGISIALYPYLLLAGVFFLAIRERKQPATASLVLTAGAVLLFATTAIRREPMTLVLNAAAGMGLLVILADTFRDGTWTRFTFIDYFFLLFRTAGHLLTGAPALMAEMQAQEEPEASGRLRRGLPILRGLLLALPILIVFAALLSSADLVFADRVDAFLEFFRLENWVDVPVRLAIIAILAYGLTGAYRTALSGVDHRKRWSLRSFLGFTEAAVVLISVNVLFALFVLIQMQYFFGGEDQVAALGYTFAEYARRGFGELVAVAVFSLVLFLGLSAVTKRQAREGRIFSWLGVVMTLLVGVILGSAFQRLLLYESAFGFTRLRTYPHVFMIWLGVLLAALALLEMFGRRERFALAVLGALFGFAATLGAVNVDGMIVRQNIARARLVSTEGMEVSAALRESLLDTPYLMTLSTDAVPALVQTFENPELPAWLRDEVGAVLACQAAEVADEMADLPWQGFHFSRARAASLLTSLKDELRPYPVSEGEFGLLEVEVNGEVIRCAGFWVLD